MKKLFLTHAMNQEDFFTEKWTIPVIILEKTHTSNSKLLHVRALHKEPLSSKTENTKYLFSFNDQKNCNFCT